MNKTKFKDTEIGRIPEDWDVKKLGEVIDKIIDYRGKTPKKTSHGVPLITAKIVKNGRILEPEEFIADEDYDDWMRRGIPQAGDVIITTEAPMGEIAQLGGRKIALAQRIITLRGQVEILDNTFLRFMLQSPKLKNELGKRESGTTVTGIKQSELVKILLPIPNYIEQQSIAKILSVLDDKIELNQQMNKTLEAIGQAIFRRWFIDFEFPNENGKPYKSSGGEMVDSELGEIPKGWMVGKVSDLVLHSKYVINPLKFADDNFYHYSIEAYDDRKVPKIEIGKTILSNKFEVKQNSILISKLNPRIPRIWAIGKIADNSVCSTEFQVMVPQKKWFYSYCYFLFITEYFTESMISRVTGTSSSHQRTRPEDILSIGCVVPADEIHVAFNNILQDIFQKMEINLSENIVLSGIRDSLLPKLMSGKIRVPVE